MFSVGAIFNYISSAVDSRITLDTTMADLLDIRAVAARFPDPALAKSRLGSLTVRQFLNMSTDVTNYLAVNAHGSTQTVVEDWMASTVGSSPNGYGQLPDFSYLNPDSIKNMIELALRGDPVSPPPGYGGEYSNSNSVIMGQVIEGLSGIPFQTILYNYLTTTLGLTNTNLQITQSDTDPGNDHLRGTQEGLEIINLDPTLAWVSGAIISNAQDMLKSIKLFSQDLARINPDNAVLIDMHGMPTLYGLGLMILNFQELDIPGVSEYLPPIISYGHGGAIAGGTSFSSYITADSPLAIGLTVYLNASSLVTPGGIYTGTASESLFLTTLDHIYRQWRASLAGATLTNSGSNYEIKYGSALDIKGGYSTANTLSANNLSVAGTFEPSYIAYFNVDSLEPTSFSVTRDPVYTYYGATDYDGSAISVSGTLTMPSWARIEGWGNGASNQLYLLELGAGSQGDIAGEVAVYGSQATAVRSTRSTPTDVTGTIEAHGFQTTALEIYSSATSTISESGHIMAVGSRATGLKLDGTGTVNLRGLIRGISLAVSLEENSVSGLIPVSDPELNGAVAVDLRAGSLNVDAGQVLALAKYPYYGAPNDSGVLVTGVKVGGTASSTLSVANGGAIVSDGSGVNFVGLGGSLTAQDAYISGQYAALKITGSAPATINLENSSVEGRVLSTSTGAVSLTAVNSQILAFDHTTPVIQSTARPIHLDITGSYVGWVSSLPTLGQTYVLISGAETATDFSGVTPYWGSPGVFSLRASSSAGGELEVEVLGLASGGSNAKAIYPAFAAGAPTTGDPAAIFDVLLDANNLTPESSLSQLAVSLEIFRLALNQSFNEILSAWPTPAAPPAAGESDGADNGADNWRVFLNYQHFTLDRDAKDTFSGYETDGDSLVLGLGRRLNERWTMAGYFGLGRSETDFEALTASIDTDFAIVGLTLGLAEQISENLSWRLIGGLSLGSFKNDYRRSVGTLLPQVNEGDFDQDFFGANLDLAFKYKITESFYLLPRLGVSFVRLEQEGLRENQTVNNFTALTTSPIKNDSLEANVNLGALYEMKFASRSLDILGSVGWIRQLGDRDITTQGHFTGQPGPLFTTKTGKIPGNALAVGLALDFQSLNRTGFGLALSYNGQLSSDQRLHQFNLGLKYAF
jgi:CubicO group peptidase (beta-lactamase class C family)